ncbi:MAG: cyclic nucleotide-binding domain-containing protein [Pseudomonadota bacterium]
MTLGLLKQSELFKKVPPEELKVLALLAKPKAFDPGTIIFSQNTLAEKIYVLDQGLVALKTSFSGGLEITYEIIKKRGDSFGWASLFEPFQHTTTAICLEKSQGIVFERKQVYRLFPQHPLLGFRVMQNLCILLARRLERTRRLLVGQM